MSKIKNGLAKLSGLMTPLISALVLTLSVPMAYSNDPQAYTPGKCILVIKHLGNLTVSGNVVIFLWNTTSTLSEPVLIAGAFVDQDGIVVLEGLPWTWNCSTVPGQVLSYSLTANYTTAEGQVTDILVLSMYEVLHRPYGIFKMTSLADLLNDISQVQYDFVSDPDTDETSDAGIVEGFTEGAPPSSPAEWAESSIGIMTRLKPI